MSYHLYDFVESLRGGSGINHDDEHPVMLKAEDVERVVAAWGHSPEGYGSWEGGFLLRLKDGRHAYLCGWCDTTGWGCQDGSKVTFFDAEPALEGLRETPSYTPDEPQGDWDLEPTDLNKWLADGAKEE